MQNFFIFFMSSEILVIFLHLIPKLSIQSCKQLISGINLLQLCQFNTLSLGYQTCSFNKFAYFSNSSILKTLYLSINAYQSFKLIHILSLLETFKLFCHYIQKLNNMLLNQLSQAFIFGLTRLIGHKYYMHNE